MEADPIPIRHDLPKPELPEPFLALLLFQIANALPLCVLCIFIVIITMTLMWLARNALCLLGEPV